MEYVGVLFTKEQLDVCTYIYKPVYIIEGKVRETEFGSRFYDELDNEYMFATDGNTITSDETNVINFIIPKEELEKAELPYNEAKNMYFEKIKRHAHIGFYSPKKEGIVITHFSLEELLTKAEKKELEQNNNKKLEYDPKEFYDKLIDFYHTGYETLKRTKTIKDFNHCVDTIQRGFLDFCNIIKDQDINTIQKDYVTDLLFSYMDELDKLKQVVFRERKKKLLTLYTSQSEYFINTKRVLMPVTIEDIEEPTIEVQKHDIEKPNVKEMKKFFDDKIIGQEEAKRDVISSIVMNKYSKNSSDRNSCLLVGPTGSGKTLIAETVAEYFDMPIEIIDTTQLTMPGYIGANIEDYLTRLYIKANGNLEKAEHGIIVFDEIDKKGTERNGDVGGKGVLNTLLPFLQGTTYNIKYNGRIIYFNTKNLTIFATGAFTDVASGKIEGSNRHYNSTRIGFNCGLEKEDKEDIKYEKLEIEDFVKYGNMPIEIMGRFTTIAQLEGHTKESLKKILTESSISPLLGEKEKLKGLGISLEYDSEYLDGIVEDAFKLKTGARSLKSIVEKSVKVARWKVLENLDTYNKIILNGNTVKDNTNFILGRLDGTLYKEKVKAKKKEG